MYIDTKNNAAMELLKEAQECVSLYQHSKELEKLNQAQSNLRGALQKDRGYLRARFWNGVVNDLLGKPEEAVAELQKVKDNIATFEPSMFAKTNLTRREQELRNFYLMVDYNLSVAQIHRYKTEEIEKAAQTLEIVISRIPNTKLKLLARARLAKAYSLKMLRKFPSGDFENKSKFFKEDFPEAKRFHDLSLVEVDKVTAEIEAKSVAQKKRWFHNPFNRVSEIKTDENEIKGLAYDAKAVAEMFYSDFDDANRIERLEEALKTLKEANVLTPKEWSIHCNSGSANMRLGHWRTKMAEGLPEDKAKKLKAEADKNFKEAHCYLDIVLNSLRPGYDFAYYEKGRVYRLSGEFEKAIENFKEAVKFTGQRNVSVDRLNFEIERAEKKLTDFP